MKILQSISKLFQKVQQNLYQISKNPSVDLETNLSVFKTPKILHDTGWIDSQSEEATKSDTYLDVYIPFTSSAQKGDRLPIIVNYQFAKELNIIERALAFTKSLILIKNHADINGVNGDDFISHNYNSPHHLIKGDGQIIYEGEQPLIGHYSSAQIASHLRSVWYYGNIAWYQGGDLYEYRRGYISNICTIFDYDSDTGYHKKFDCPAIDNICSSAIAGTGTYTVVTATINETKNYTMTAPLWEKTTTVEVCDGELYINGSYQNQFPQTIVYSATPPTFDFEVKNYRLWYSNKRAREFRCVDYTLTNLPKKSDYQTYTLPYTKMYVKVNPGNYPEKSAQTHDGDNDNGQDKPIWIKKTNNIYKHLIRGTIQLSLPATQLASTHVDTVDEDYSQVGITYTKDGENRPGKDLPIYNLPDINLQVKNLISLNTPNDYSTLNKNQLQKD